MQETCELDSTKIEMDMEPSLSSATIGINEVEVEVDTSDENDTKIFPL